VADAEFCAELADGLIMAHSGLLERSRAVEDFLAFGCCYSIHLVASFDAARAFKRGRQIIVFTDC